MITALYVEPNGIYFNDPRIDPYDLKRDAFTYCGRTPVIAHPPCKRWGRYWSGGPSAKVKRYLGDDRQTFAHAIWCVRTFGGVIEHPEASHAWRWFGLERPPMKGGWVKADSYGGVTCCVAQGHYGHRAQKLTWLYGVNISTPELKWGKCPGKQRLDEGFHSKAERNTGVAKGNRLGANENLATPAPFKELLISMVKETTPRESGG